MHVLIVEDSPTQREHLETQLRDAGHTVIAVSGADEALVVLEREAVAAVVSDVVMEGMDGFELCREIKRRWPDTPVLLLTSLSEPTDIISGLEAGADNFLTKPYDLDYLVDRLTTLVKRRKLPLLRKLDVGMHVEFMGRTFTISAAREQILSLLISTVEDAVRQNRELRQREQELTAAKAALDRYAGALEARLDHVLKSIPDVVFSLDVDLGTVHYVSPAVEHVMGCPQREFAFGWVVAHTHEDDRGVLADALAAARASGEPRQFEFRMTPPDGRTRWISANLVPVVENGMLVRADGIARDVTDRVEAEERLRRAEEQFRQAQKMEAIGQLAGGVAHDFNNLLMVVRGEADLALAGDLPASLRESFNDIRAAAERATALTKQLLIFSRRDEVSHRVLDANAVVEGIEKMLRRLIGETVQVTVTLDPDAGSVHADQGQLEQVIVNLAVNARDAMPEGGALEITTNRVHVAAEESLRQGVLERGDYVRLAFRDTGTGMTDAVMERAFDPFFTTKAAGKGTGLGLATAYGIVKDAGGAIDVESAPGAGTTISIYLPRTASESPARSRTSAGTLQGGTETILVVEDQAEVRRIADRILARLGYRVHAVGTGEEALALLADNTSPVHLVITDVVLAGMSGPEVARRICELRPDVRVIFMSGYDKNTRPAGALERAPRLQKPFTPQAMARAVRAVLDAPPFAVTGAGT